MVPVRHRAIDNCIPPNEVCIVSKETAVDSFHSPVIVKKAHVYADNNETIAGNAHYLVY